MKRTCFFLALLLFISFGTIAQNKLLTIEDSQKKLGLLTPKRLQQTYWLKKTTEFYFVDRQELQKVDTRQPAVIKKVISITQLNKDLKNFTKDTIVYFPILEWNESNSFNFKQGDSIYTYDMKTSNLKLSAERPLPSISENSEKCDKNNIIAHCGISAK